MLAAPDFNAPFKLAVDASDVAPGAVLLQEDNNGVDHSAVTLDFYGRHVSDWKIVIASGILDMLEPHGSVMTDRGFEIQDLLVPKKVSLNIPPFMRCKDQLDPDEKDETRQIAAVRIHVERAIERIKNYNFLKQIIPKSMTEDLNKIWNVCSYLTNLNGPLVV